MQNAVNHCIRNRKYFFYLHSVTSSRFGNNPANDLGTEILQYFTLFFLFEKWEINVK